MKQLIILFLFIVASLGFTVPTPAQQLPETKETRAYRIVRDAPYFAIGGTGYAGTLSEGERALHVLIATRDTRYFSALLKEKNSVAKLYGLSALRYYNASQDKTLAATLSASKASVQTMNGCVIDLEPVSNVVKRISKGEFDSMIAEDIKRANRNK